MAANTISLPGLTPTQKIAMIRELHKTIPATHEETALIIVSLGIILPIMFLILLHTLGKPTYSRSNYITLNPSSAIQARIDLNPSVDAFLSWFFKR
jgi:hypothetical protein